MLKVLSIIGTRPEAVKMAPVIAELCRHPERIAPITCSTGQHREMLDQMSAQFGFGIDVDLGVMRPNQTLSSLTGRLFEALEPVVLAREPDWVLAQGDTTTVLVASLVAYYHRIPFGHVEAGLRTGDLYQPFPEELNRTVADVVATLMFAPTELSRERLLREGKDPARVIVTGNTVVDALMSIARQRHDWAGGPLAPLADKARLVLVTAHRRESFGRPLEEMCLAIRELADRWSDAGVHFVYPVHLNPNVCEPVRKIFASTPNVTLLEPLDYSSLVHLMRRCVLVLTDSGGIQEEAPTFGVPVLVMRETTERPEGVQAGVAKLVGSARARIVEEATRVLAEVASGRVCEPGPNPYGDGNAAARIVQALLQHSR